MKKLGTHFILEVTNIESTTISTHDIVKEKMLLVCRDLKLKIVSEFFQQFSPHGVSGVVILQESHLTIHTWPENRYAAIDLFVCTPYPNQQQLEETIKKNFSGTITDIRVLVRGYDTDG